MIFPVRVLIGLGALALSIPFLIVGCFVMLGGRNPEWWMDNCPLIKWWEYLENR